MLNLFVVTTVGLIGYEQTLYTVEENAGSVEICVNLFEPNDASLIDPIVAVSFFVETVDGTARGKCECEGMLLMV